MTALDVSELERFVTAESDRLVGEALHAMEQLELSPTRLDEFRQELRGTLTSLTFPCDEANIGRRTYGLQ